MDIDCIKNKKSQDLFGIINVNKPKGFTSHDVVAKLRKILNTKQIGHTGTLDPMATGVLPVCIGKATKIIQYLESSKAYRAFIKLGIKTDTYDMEGKILKEVPVKISTEKAIEFLNKFKGEITQTPPIYSAVHYKGKRLYEYARKNIELTDIPTRKVIINSIELIEIAEKDTDNPVLVVDIDCAEGTYIRSIASDLGENLGCGACLSGLIRTKAGKFILQESQTLEEIEILKNTDDLNKIFTNPVNILPLKIFDIDELLLEKIKNGQHFSVELLPSFTADLMLDKSDLIQLVYKNKLAAIARIEDNKIKPVNVFVTGM